MKVIQVLTTLSYGDAVGNDCVALMELLKKQGYKTSVYAENIDQRIKIKDIHKIEKFISVEADDIIIYHLSTGTKLNEWIKTQNCKKIMIYHNITPPIFLEKYSIEAANLCRKGLEQVKELKNTFDYVLADSDFNRQNLIDMGYKCRIDVLPILIPFEDYNKKPDIITIKKYADNYTNIIFVGRIAPNKKHEDIIKAFKMYNERYNPKSRLILVGSYNGMAKYYHRLKEYISKLGVKNVVFTGHIRFDKILAYYKIADLFLCMSEHEGFCVPLLEAMHFNVPIVAYDSCAIKGTLGGSGFLINEKNYSEIAGAINRIITDEKLKKTIVNNQDERLEDFDVGYVGKQFLEYLNDYISEVKQ